MKRVLKFIAWAIAIILIIWAGITIWAESEGVERMNMYGKAGSVQRALIVYDADPLYNLDQKVCETFATALADHGWHVVVATVPKAKKLDTERYDLYVFCANTYNWAPDMAVKSFIRNSDLKGKNVVAITLGAGSTHRAKQILEETLRQQQSTLLDSKTFWLLRPNNERRLNESNVSVAMAMVSNWAIYISRRAGHDVSHL